MSELHNYLRQVETAAKIFTIHGEEKSCEALSRWASSELSMDAVAPKTGDQYTV